MYATQKLANGEWYEQYQFAGPNWDTEFVPLDTCDLQCFDTDSDGSNPRLAKKDGSKITVVDQLGDAERIVGAALDEGVKIDLIGPDSDIKRKGMYKVVVTFTEVDDLNDDDAFTEQGTQVMSFRKTKNFRFYEIILTLRRSTNPQPWWPRVCTSLPLRRRRVLARANACSHVRICVRVQACELRASCVRAARELHASCARAACELGQSCRQ